MKKIRLLFTLMSLILLTSCILNTYHIQYEPKLEFNAVYPKDKEINISGKQVVLNFNISYSVYPTKIDIYFGKSKTPGFLKSMEITDSPHNFVSTIDNIDENTTYYWKVKFYTKEKTYESPLTEFKTLEKFILFEQINNSIKNLPESVNIVDQETDSFSFVINGKYPDQSPDIYMVDRDNTVNLSKYNENYYYYPIAPVIYNQNIYINSRESSFDSIKIFDKKGNFISKINQGTQNQNLTNPVIDDGNVYIATRKPSDFGTSTLKGYDTNGSEILSIVLNREYKTLYISDNNFILNNNTNITCVNKEGKRLWSKNIEHGDPVLGRDGSIYFTVSDSIYALNPDGQIQWVKRFNNNICQYLIIDNDNMICTYSDNIIYFINREGIEVKKLEIPFHINNICMDKDNIYIVNNYALYSSQAFTLHSFDKNGKKAWSVSKPEKFYIIIGKEGSLFIIDKDKISYIKKKDTPPFLWESKWKNSDKNLVNKSEIINIPPNLTGPENNSQIKIGTCVLKWNTTQGSKYDLYFGKNSETIDPIEKDILTGNYEIKSLAPETKYFWRVTEKKSNGYVVSSKVYSFYSEPSDYILYWKHKTTGKILTDMKNDGTEYVYLLTSDKTGHALDRNGNEAATYNFDKYFNYNTKNIHISKNLMYLINIDTISKWNEIIFDSHGDCIISDLFEDDSNNFYFFTYKKLYKIDNKGTIIYSKDTGTINIGNVVHTNNKTYYYSDNNFYILDPSGNEIKKIQIQSEFMHNIIFKEDKIFVYSKDRKIHIFDAAGNETGNIDVESDVSGFCCGSDGIYCSSGNKIIKYSFQGSKLGEQYTDSDITGMPEIIKDKLIISDKTGNLYFYGSTLSNLYKYKMESESVIKPLYANSKAIIGTVDGSVYAFGIE